jgi:hypothetical protein
VAYRHARARSCLHGRQLLDHGPPWRPQVGPRFDAQLTQIGSPTVDEHPNADDKLIEQFRGDPMHRILKTLSGMRSSVDISVQ